MIPEAASLGCPSSFPRQLCRCEWLTSRIACTSGLVSGLYAATAWPKGYALKLLKLRSFEKNFEFKASTLPGSSGGGPICAGWLTISFAASMQSHASLGYNEKRGIFKRAKERREGAVHAKIGSILPDRTAPPPPTHTGRASRSRLRSRGGGAVTPPLPVPATVWRRVRPRAAGIAGRTAALRLCAGRPRAVSESGCPI
eukprot:364484-Chlamydomonas_euryale.AAC.7